MIFDNLHEMSELYRKTRKIVYEEATRPLSNWIDGWVCTLLSL